MAQQPRRVREKVEAFSQFSLMLPIKSCDETALEVVEKDAMGNWYTGPLQAGFCTLDFAPRPGVVEFIIVEELEGQEALAATEVVLPQKEAVRFLQRFGHAYRLHLQSGKRLIYIAGFNHEESHLYWQALPEEKTEEKKKTTRTRTRKNHQKSLPTLEYSEPLQRKTRKGKQAS